MERFNIIISTDGACSCNPGPGGYAAVLRFGEHKKEIVGYEPRTTNNKMELRAVIEAAKALKKPSNVVFRVDSKYICTGMANAKEWCKNGWRTKSGAKCANVELWQELFEVGKVGKHKFQALWVKGHDGDADNDRCDFLAKEQIRIHQKGE